MSTAEISAEDPYPRQRVAVGDSEMAYIDTGAPGGSCGPPVVFIHGNPTSSYLWRNVIPHVASLGRCLAPDLIGMGASAKMPSGGYRFVEHVAYLDTWLEAVGAIRDVIFVLHDWGGALGFHRTHRFPDQVAGIAYMEVMVRPRLFADLPEGRDKIFRAFRTEEGDKMVLDDNFFVETMLFKNGTLRTLTEHEKGVYRAPYRTRDSRWPTLMWPREIPFDGEPSDNCALVDAYSKFMTTSPLPKLFINAEQGHALAGPPREFCRTWPNQTEVALPGRHYLQEDFPHEVGQAIADFVQRVRS